LVVAVDANGGVGVRRDSPRTSHEALASAVTAFDIVFSKAITAEWLHYALRNGLRTGRSKRMTKPPHKQALRSNKNPTIGT